MANDASHWHIGFDVDTTTADYLILIDVDRMDGQGASHDPAHGLPIVTAHRPEYAVHILQDACVPATGECDEKKADFYVYESGSWLTRQELLSVGGVISYTNSTILDGFLQVQLELGSLGTPGTVAVQVAAFNSAGQIGDTLPPSRAGELDGFVSISEEVMPISPPTNATGDSTTHAHIPVLRWHPHADAKIHLTQGYAIQIARDPEFSTIVRQEVNFRWPGYTVDTSDLDSDNTYYWRARVKHEDGSGGPYNSHPWRFDRRGLIPQAPQVEVLGSSVTFSWDMVEGTDRYYLQWSTDPNFGSYISADVRAWEYTPEALLTPGTYYWRVRARHWQGEQNAWAERGTFTVQLPIPTGLTVEPADSVVRRTPTLTWSPYLAPTNGIPRFSAWRYGVQICRDENMTNDCRKVVTEQHSWTPPYTFAEGALYWRVQLIDGNGRTGEWTELTPVTNLITKQYPAPTLTSPQVGAALDATPTFRWAPVNTMAYYRVEVSQDRLFAKLYDSVETAATEYTPLKAYDTAQYYWRVCVRDKDNRQGPCTDSIILLNPLPYQVFLPMSIRH